MSDQLNIPAVDSLPGKLGIGKIKTCNQPTRLERFKQFTKYLGPAFIVSVAYIDPPVFVLEHIIYGFTNL